MYENFLAYARIWFKANRWQAIAIALSFLVVGMAIGAPANAAINQALISTAGAKIGEKVSLGTSTAAKYDIPKSADLVRVGTSWDNFTWEQFGTLVATDTVDTCSDELPAPTVYPIPWSAAADACKHWAAIPISQVAKSDGVLWVNSTGNLSFTWSKPVFDVNAIPEAQLTGYKLYSGVYQGTLTLLRTLPVGPLALAIPGYGNGKYSFALSAVYGTTESPQTGPVSIEVRIPDVPKEARAPAVFGIQ